MRVVKYTKPSSETTENKEKPLPKGYTGYSTYTLKRFKNLLAKDALPGRMVESLD